MAGRAEPMVLAERRNGNGHAPAGRPLIDVVDSGSMDANDRDDARDQGRDDSESLRANESDILDLMLGVAEGRQEYEVVPVAHKGRRFRFLVQTIDHDTYKEAFRDASRYTRDRMTGGQRQHEDTNNGLFYGLLIYEATVERPHAVYQDTPEQVKAGGPLLGRSQCWDNEELQRRLLPGEKDLNKRRAAAKMITSKILKPGEAELIVSQIDRLSGYGHDLEDLGKD